MGMAQAANRGDRVLRFWLRLLVFGAAGPPVGGLATLAAFGPLAFLWDGTALSLREDIVPMLPAAMFFGYVLGGIPALLTGAVDGILAVQGVPARCRLAWDALAGAGMSLPVALIVGGMIPNPFTLIVALAGALASLACGGIAAWIDRFLRG